MTTSHPFTLADVDVVAIVPERLGRPGANRVRLARAYRLLWILADTNLVCL